MLYSSGFKSLCISLSYLKGDQIHLHLFSYYKDASLYCGPLVCCHYHIFCFIYICDFIKMPKSSKDVGICYNLIWFCCFIPAHLVQCQSYCRLQPLYMFVHCRFLSLSTWCILSSFGVFFLFLLSVFLPLILYSMLLTQLLFC